MSKEKKPKAKDFYIPKENAEITEKRFRKLFYVNRSDSFGLTAVLSNMEQVVWDTGKYTPRTHGWTTFYELGEDGHGGYCMKQKRRLKNYNELVDYLFEIGQEYRLELSKEQTDD